MLNFVKKSHQIKKFSIQKLDFYRSVCMTAICYIVLILAVSTNEQLLAKKKTCAKFQSNISNTEGLVCVYTDRRTWLNLFSRPRWSFIYILYRVFEFTSWCHKFYGKFNIPCSVYKKQKEQVNKSHMWTNRTSTQPKRGRMWKESKYYNNTGCISRRYVDRPPKLLKAEAHIKVLVRKLLTYMYKYTSFDCMYTNNNANMHTHTCIFSIFTTN